MPAFDTVSEVILYVEDMDRMVSFYTEVFDLAIAEGHPDHGFVQFDTEGTALCLHAGGQSEGLEGAPKVVFAVDDLTAARAHLREHGVEVGEIRSPAPGVEVCDGRDPEGNAFSIEAG